MTDHALVALGVLTGIALSAAVGFRIFLPFLAVAVALKLGLVHVANDFAWLASTPALIVLTVANVSEISAYYIPWVDHVLDVLGGPVAVLAGTLLTASMIIGLDDWLRWSLALIAGGGVAGSLHLGKSLIRGMSTAATGGLANPVVSTVEWVVSIIAAILALVVPILMLLVVAAIFLYAWRKGAKRKRLPASNVTP